VVDRLRAGGAEVQVVDDLVTGDRANLAPGVVLHAVDIADAAALAGALEGERFDAVVHCAARTKVVQSVAQPELYRRVLVDGTRNVVEAARLANASAFVNFSTGGALYGETPSCASEDAPARPESPYGAFKEEAERIVADSGLVATTLRPANIYGPRQRTDLEGGVIAVFFGCWRRGEPLTVFGDGTAERDYVYVGDVAEAVAAAIERGASGTYNVGTGIATSVDQVIAAMTSLLGPPAGVTHAPSRGGELQRSCVDASKAARDLGWKPRTSLGEGLRLTAASTRA
ncbi:MAG: NAD-dependent epimerase/dehydratase family protein, partial [Candidatus Limnocylindria bacterium]